MDQAGRSNELPVSTREWYAGRLHQDGRIQYLPVHDMLEYANDCIELWFIQVEGASEDRRGMEAL